MHVYHTVMSKYLNKVLLCNLCKLTRIVQNRTEHFKQCQPEVFTTLHKLARYNNRIINILLMGEG